jgi:hypothetical protein
MNNILLIDDNIQLLETSAAALGAQLKDYFHWGNGAEGIASRMKKTCVKSGFLH